MKTTKIDTTTRNVTPKYHPDYKMEKSIVYAGMVYYETMPNYNCYAGMARCDAAAADKKQRKPHLHIRLW